MIPSAHTDDEHYLRLAIAQAQAAEAAGEVPVGAVIVSPAGDVLGEGNNHVIRLADPTAHAEVVAMRAAAARIGNYRLTGCTLYCTLEPCAMCAGAMLHARLGRLVYAARDPKAGADGSVLAVINHPALNHRVDVLSGLLAEEASLLLTNFFRRKRNLPPRQPASQHVTEAGSDGNEESFDEVRKENGSQEDNS